MDAGRSDVICLFPGSIFYDILVKQAASSLVGKLGVDVVPPRKGAVAIGASSLAKGHSMTAVSAEQIHPHRLRALKQPRTALFKRGHRAVRL